MTRPQLISEAKFIKPQKEKIFHMAVSDYSLTQNEQQTGISRPHGAHAMPFLRAPSGYTSWHAWLSGKVLPFTIFTLLLVTNGLSLPGEAIQWVREGTHFYSLVELIRHSFMFGFILLIVAAYFTRTHAVARARGFRERIFPLSVLFTTFVGISFLRGTEGLQRLDLITTGLLLTVLGYYISLWALWHLRGSFAVMAEARSPITSGPYRYVRHPLYLGEMLSMLGLCLAIGTATALLLWAVITGMQLVRASIEEAKLAQQFADYRSYRERTRFILPGLY